MKKSLLFVMFSLWLGISSYANDTLTRAQVYDFAIGDTFEYYKLDYAFPSVPPPNAFQIYRYVYETRVDDSVQHTIAYTGKLLHKTDYWNQTGPVSWHHNIIVDSSGFNLIIDSIYSCCFNPYTPDYLTGFCSTDSSLLAGPDSLGRLLTPDTLNGHIGLACIINDFSFIGNTAVHKRIGMTSSIEYYEDGSQPKDYRLIFYHLTSGEQWGFQENFAMTDVSELPAAGTNFSFYPNPATNSITITVDETMLNSTLTVYDITGKKMAAAQLRASDIRLPTLEFSSGIYFVTIENEKGRATKKLVIEK